MKGGMGNLMKQAQQMQEEMQKAQEEIAAMEVEGKSGGGLVTVTMTGTHECRRVQISDTLVGEDKDMLEDFGRCCDKRCVAKSGGYHQR